MLPCPRAVCVRCWVWGPPSSSILRPRAWCALCNVWGSPSDPYLRVVGARCLVRGPPPPPPPWWPHALSAHDWLGGICSSSPSSCMPRDRSACCPVSYPVSVAAHPSSAVPLVPPWPSPLTRGPMLARPPSGSSGDNMPYSRNECVPFLGLAPLAPSDCCGWVPALLLSSATPPLRAWRRRRPPPARYGLVAAIVSSLLAWLGGRGVSVPYPTLSVLPRHSLTLDGHSGGFVPPWKIFHSGGVDALR